MPGCGERCALVLGACAAACGGSARGSGERAGPAREDWARRTSAPRIAGVRALLGAAAACSAPAACPCARRAPLRLTGRPARADGGVRRARAAGPERAQAVQCGSVRGMSAAPRRAAAAATARWQWAAMKGAPLTGACSCEVGVREAAASVLGPCMSLGRGAPACQRRQSVRTARCWELAHLGALDDGSATHLLRHTGGRASARRSAPTHPTAPIPQDHLRHALAASTGRGAPDRPPVSESWYGTTPACSGAGEIPSGTLWRSPRLGKSGRSPLVNARARMCMCMHTP